MKSLSMFLFVAFSSNVTACHVAEFRSLHFSSTKIWQSEPTNESQIKSSIDTNSSMFWQISNGPLTLFQDFISIMSWITSIILNFPNFIHDSVWIIIKKSISSYNYFRWIELFQLQLRVQGVVQLKYKDERKEMFDEFRRLPPIEGIKRLLLGRFVRMTLLFKCSHISLQTIPFYAIAKN
jgi:hypothetical protein